MILFIAAALQAASPSAAPTPAIATVKGADPRQVRYDACVRLAATDPAAAHAEAMRWGVAGGAWFARQCAGLAYAQEGDFAAAASEFEAAARAAEAARDKRAANYWAQAGNAQLAAGNVPKARAALGTALVAGTLEGFALGEAQLDHARVLVAAGDPEAARRDIDLALTHVADDPLAWLLSATLARRQGNLARAKMDIAEALKRSADDASVQLEAGNIAAAGQDETGARTAWAAAARLGPDTPAGRNAAAALKQFGDTPAAPPSSARVPAGR